MPYLHDVKILCLCNEQGEQLKLIYFLLRLDEIFFTPLFILALPLAACLGVVVFGIEEFFPWTTEVNNENCHIFIHGILMY